MHNEQASFGTLHIYIYYIVYLYLVNNILALQCIAFPVTKQSKLDELDKSHLHRVDELNSVF